MERASSDIKSLTEAIVSLEETMRGGGGASKKGKKVEFKALPDPDTGHSKRVSNFLRVVHDIELE